MDQSCELFITALIPVLKILFATLLGSYLALDRVNILGEDARKHLNTSCPGEQQPCADNNR
ncbi:Auxin efflux carrier family protein [Prunus dulcis]|uniref:Auxin efflux carrier family protein n=1 Tax=Prunus dulcis TaxID=3755 RepID=A0A4Y1REX3_PRUDU|nr:Auxin efflux carrier family protein [Prunus dulcis]